MRNARPAPTPSRLEAGQSAAKLLAGEWSVDVDAPTEEPVPTLEFPSPEAASTPVVRDAPPSTEQIVEAALFVGGPPLTAEKVQTAMKIPPALFLATIDGLNRRYKAQRRPYGILPKEGGYVLGVHPQFRGLREKLFGGPREARLSQQAVDVLSLIAYRQPVEKSEIDAVRGYDSGGVLRQLVRLGLVNVLRRGEAGHSEVAYGTTPRFLALFQLSNLDDLPRLGEAEVS